MAKINLLPWREAYRKEKKEQFIAILVGVFVLSAVLAYAWISSVESAIENQKSRNRLLETEIAALEKQVQEIAELKKVRDDLLTRIKVIQDLEGTRPVIVRYFDDLVRAVPDGVHLNSVVRKGDVISLEGIAESTNRVSSFMRNLDQSDWFTAPNLTSVTAAPAEGEQANSFRMTVRTSAPQEQADATANEEGK
ncbi:MAG: PilN domain-containing protein [Cellvibrio sp.]|jgi:Tfp pilus assembly protein PilN